MGKWWLLSLVCAALPAGAQGSPATPEHFRDQINRADVVLMPGWENQDVANAAPLHPTVVAWGEDAVWGTSERKRNALKYRAMGVNHLAANVWMLTATKEKLAENEALREASCRDIKGTKLIPPWLDDGVSYWGCTNQPAFREQLRERVRAGMLAGANLLHLDDHLGSASAAENGGCYCNACLSGFRDWLAGELSTQQLEAAGIKDIAEFNYRDHLQQRGITSRVRYDAKLAELPLRAEFLAFQRDAINDFVAELKTLAAQTAGTPVPLGINAWNLVPSQLANTHLADYFSNEIKHYNEEQRHPPYVYKLADALGKPVFGTATGEGWSRIHHNEQVARLRHWLAMSYAFGHQFMFAFKQWAFDPEHGTSWYEPAVSVYRPVTDFVHSRALQLNGYQPLARVGVIYSNSNAAENDAPLRDLVEHWHELSVQFRMLAAGDEVLQQRLTLNAIEGLEFVCALEGTRLPDQQQAVFELWQRQGKAGRCSQVPQLDSYRLKVSGRSSQNLNVWALARIHDERAPVVHLLNQNLNAKTGAPQPAQAIQLQLPHTLLGKVRGAVLHRPQQASQLLQVAFGKSGAIVHIDTLHSWAILELRL